MQALNTPPPPPVFPKVAAYVSGLHATSLVPPALEIEVLDPNVDPRGNPAVLTRPAAVLTSMGPEGRMVVDIPPTVLVHRYYYTGDRSFQAGLLPGGPCIVVVSHPKTGERLYIPVQFPPGAPRVTYTGNSIEYDYGTQAVTISFCCLINTRPKVTYRNGMLLTQKLENVAVDARDATRRLVSRTAIPKAADKVASGTKSFVFTTMDKANDLAKQSWQAPPIALINKATPLGTLFTESPEDQAAKARASLLQRAQDQALHQEDAFIKTNR